MKGIIMSGNHPKLILDGTKTQTRRVVKPQPKLLQPWGLKDMFDGSVWIDKWKRVWCPYGQVGDRLWVRETFCEPRLSENKSYYKSSGDILPVGESWRPSIFMPRWASRITLEITAIRVERLRKATLADAIAEGFRTIVELIKAVLYLNHLPEDADSWVWVISFRRVDGS